MKNVDPRIGTLNREGKTVYYAYVAGVYVEGSVDDLTTALAAGVVPPAKVAAPQRKTTLRSYDVTVHTKMTVYFGSATVTDLEVVMVEAATAKEAISMVRKTRRDIEGRHAVPATFTARLSK